MLVQLLAVGQAVPVAVGVGRVGRLVVVAVVLAARHLLPVGQAVVVGVGVVGVGPVVVLLPVVQPVTVGVVVGGQDRLAEPGAGRTLGGGQRHVGHDGGQVAQIHHERARDRAAGLQGQVGAQPRDLTVQVGALQQRAGGPDDGGAGGHLGEDLGDGGGLALHRTGQAVAHPGVGDLDLDRGGPVTLVQRLADDHREGGVGQLVGHGGAGVGHVGAGDRDVDVGQLLQAQQGQGGQGVAGVEVQAGDGHAAPGGVGDDLVEHQGGDLDRLGQAQRIHPGQGDLHGDREVHGDDIVQRDLLSEDGEPLDRRGGGHHAAAVHRRDGADRTHPHDGPQARSVQEGHP